LTVWIEQGSGAILAGVIRGAPPTELREVFQETLETIQAQFSELLQTFQGDATSFQETRLPLEDCLQAQFEKKSKGLPLVFWILLGLLLLGLGIWAFQARSDQQRWAQLLERVGQEPGLVVTSIQEEGQPTIFYGLRDPLAVNPEQILSEFGYSSKQAVFRLKPFMDLTPEFVHKRAVLQLRPPGSVVVSWEGTTLVLAGEAPHAWIQQTHLLGPLIPGVTHIQMGQLIDTDVKQFETVKAKLERNTLSFEVGESSLRQDQRSALPSIAETIQAIDQMASVLDIATRIQIQGFTSPDGRREANQALSLRRAKTVLNELDDGSFRATSLQAVGMGPALSKPVLSPMRTGVSPGRQVGFRVVADLDPVSESR
jgi:OOP family OmpA-OmpF porin